jgi:hypothetical protein
VPHDLAEQVAVQEEETAIAVEAAEIAAAAAEAAVIAASEAERIAQDRATRELAIAIEATQGNEQWQTDHINSLLIEVADVRASQTALAEMVAATRTNQEACLLKVEALELALIPQTSQEAKEPEKVTKPEDLTKPEIPAKEEQQERKRRYRLL